ncbi:MAG: carbohydrate kinase family protein [Anaerolineae bacterium]|nr:carbohydrate kinase family protein [Anaerolineae bacterium]
MTYGEHRVLVVGAAGLDLKVRAKSDTVALARSNPGVIRRAWGGVARNIAENLARLGADVTLVSAVGNDWWGRALLGQLRDLGIDTDPCIISDQKPTASYVALYHEDRRLWVAFDDMAVIGEITPGHLNRLRRLFREADMICVDANLSPRSFQTLFRLATQYDVPVCADPTAALLAHRLQPYLSQITALTPDPDEAMALTGEPVADDEDISAGARRLVQAGVDLAIITLGADGLYYATSDESGRLPPFPVDIVDLTGAGDALTAAVAYGLLEEVSPGEAVRLGMAAAAQTIACPETVCPRLTPELLYERLVI